jgi:hypothetical protein
MLSFSQGFLSSYPAYRVTSTCSWINDVQHQQNEKKKNCNYICDISLKLSRSLDRFNPLNAELNPICHLPLLLGDLTFMGPCIVSIFQYISNKMQRYTIYLHLETTLQFRVVLAPIIRSAYNCIYSIWSAGML